MKFVTLTESEYRKFWQTFPEKCFLSAPGIGGLHDGATVYYLGVKENGKVVAAAMVRGVRRHFGKYDFYAPRGVLVDFNNPRLAKFFLTHLRDFLRAHGGYVFHMDPNVELVERDIDGHIVEGGRDNHDVVALLDSLGFVKSRYVEGVSQVTWEFVLPTKGRTRDEIYEQMGTNARRRLRQALDLGMDVKDLKKDEIGSFYEVLKGTAARKDFLTRDFAYFEKMYDLFASTGGVEFVSITLNPAKTLTKLRHDLAAEERRIPKSPEDKRMHINGIKYFKNRIKRLEQLFPDSDDRDIVLSSGMFMTIKPEILHFLGGNVGEYLNLDAQYVLQWEMIGRTIDRGYDRYNFYGIPANIDKHPAGYGIYAFKRGFSGHVVELIGEYELPLSPVYYITKFLTNTKSALRRLLGRG